MGRNGIEVVVLVVVRLKGGQLRETERGGRGKRR